MTGIPEQMKNLEYVQDASHIVGMKNVRPRARTRKRR